MTLSAADAYYTVAGLAVITAETVHCPDLRRAARAARSLTNRTSDLELWVSYRRIARRIFWELLNLPLPFHHRRLGLSEAATELYRLATDLEDRSDPVTVSEGVAVAETVERLAHTAFDPLGERARAIVLTGSPPASAVLIHDARLRDAVERRFNKEGCPVRVLVPTQLPDLEVVETLVITGQAKFYPESILNAPRAENICIVRYSWLRDVEKIEGLLPASARTRTAGRVRGGTPEADSDEDDYVMPGVDWKAIKLRGVEPLEAESDPDAYHGRLFLLAGGFGVYLESVEGTSVLGLDPEGEGEQRVRRILTTRVRSGDIILLRKERGGGDFLEDLANQLLGSDATQLRATQRRWKELLRNQAREKSVAQVARELRERGTRVQNVRYWMSPSNIRTSDLADFRILMQYIGLGAEADLIWLQMDRIDEAHRRAGQRIRHRLVERVRDADLSALVRDGYMDFELSEEAAGVLTAFRVEARAPDAAIVPRHQLCRLFLVERDLWLA